MFRNYVKIAYRNLLSHRFFTALNIFGLSLGIAGGIILFQFITYHLSFDRYHRHAAQLFRVVTDLHLADGSVEYDQGTPLRLTEVLQHELPEIQDQAVLLRQHSFTVGIPLGGNWKFFVERENSAFTDQHWFTLFDYHWYEGNPQTSLKEPNTAVITRKLAYKYFGKEEPVGKTIRLDSKYNVTVTGVLEDYPKNTDLKVDLFLSRSSFQSFYPELEANMSRNWGDINSTTNSYLWLPGGVPDKRLEDSIKSITRAVFGADMASAYQFHLQPLKAVHFDIRYGAAIQGSLLSTLTLVGLFLVLIACFNYINLATALSAKRAKEIGTRKVLGSTASGIFWQFITETTCIAILATILSLAWIQLTLPFLNDWLQMNLGFNFLQDRGLLLCLLLMMGMVIVASGFYPALILSRWRPVDALKERITSIGSQWSRKGLVVVQNIVVQVLIFCTLTISLQMRHIKTTNPGFNKNNILMVPIPNPDKGKLLHLSHLVKLMPDIKSISFCFQAPLSDKNWAGSIEYDHKPWENFVARTIYGDADYLRTFQMQLLAGRNLQPSDTVQEFLVNETLVHKLGINDLQSIIGHQLVAGAIKDHPGVIVGVVRDFNVHPLYSALEPALLTTKRDIYQYAAIKFDPSNANDLRDKIQKIWLAVYPENVFEYHYLNAQIDAYYHKEDLLVKLINTSAGVAIIISCLGLFGLVSFFANQRTKEIGIRKVLGANVTALFYLLSRDFLELVLLSIIIAAPISWWFMHQWLLNFAFRINIAWWMFISAGSIAMLIALLTVSFQAIKSALANPVKSLRTE